MAVDRMLKNAFLNYAYFQNIKECWDVPIFIFF